jgi:hypothetical protein
MNRRIVVLTTAVTAFALHGPAFAFAPLGSGFTFQGRLKSAGSPASGPHDLEFRLFDAASLGNQIGLPVVLNGVPVNDGLFTVQLNTAGEFGPAAMDGSRRWLETRVNGTTLAPRQELTAAPYALYALAGAGGSGPWQLNGSSVFYNGGNVGIGTAAPVDKLDVASGDASYFRVNGTWGDLHVNGGNDGAFGLFNDSTAAGASIEMHTSQGQAMKITRDRKIGINTSPTAAQLTVNPSDGEGILVSTILGSQPLIHAQDSSFFGNPGTADCIVGEADNGYGVRGDSFGNDGVFGQTHSALKSGVWGNNDSGTPGGHGVTGSCANGIGVFGQSNISYGVYGTTNSTAFNVAGVYGQAVGNGQVVGVYGVAQNGTTAAGVVGVGATGGYFASNGLGANTALWANGLCKVGTLQILGGADLAEPFDVAGDDVQPGMVVVIDPDHPGRLKPCDRACDRKVAGIISGAGGVATGLSMGHEGTLASGRHPVALSGRVYCLADASASSIQPGDMLTTAACAGHAMKAADFDAARGAILGKAMTGLKAGRGLVLVLVNLQ